MKKIMSAGSLIAACLVLCLASSPLRSVTAAPARGAAVEALTFQESKDGGVVALITTAPVPQFTCTLVMAEPRQVVIDFPVANSRLEKRYDLDSSLVREILVERYPETGLALRIRVHLGEGVLAALELADQGLNLRFQGGAPAPIQEATASTTEYLVGAGDKLAFSVFGHPDFSRILEVRGDGTIDFPLIGNVPVGGKSLAQIGLEITRDLGKDYIIDPQVSVNVQEYGSKWVTVMGGVNTPGRYLLRQKMGLFDLLAEAGGLTPFANRKKLEILRSESDGLRRKLVVNLKVVEKGKEAEPSLLAGDVVIVPRRTF